MAEVTTAAAELLSMKSTIGVGQLRASTLDYMNMVAAGTTLRVLRRGRLVALILPVPQIEPERPRTEATQVHLRAFRSEAGRHLDKVSAGTTLRIIYDGRPVADVTPA